MTHGSVSPAHKAIVNGCTSFLVGLTIFAVLAMARHIPVVGPFVRYVQIIGIDLGLYVDSFVHPVPHATKSAVRYRYVFLDVDREACATLYKDSRCIPTAPADRRIVAGLISLARESGALVVVVDIASAWPGPADDALADALTMHSAGPVRLPPVVLPLMFDVQKQQTADEKSFYYTIQPMLKWSGPAHAPPGANIYFGLPLSSSGEGVAAGDVVRAYARSIAADPKTGGSEPGATWTLAGIAACLARDQGKDVRDCATVPTATRPEWIRYSIPPLVPQPDGDMRGTAARAGSLVRYLTASNELAVGGKATVPLPVLRGAIVLIGSSRDIRDYHPTPFGPMAGAEIVLNSIRSLLEFRVVGDAGLFGSLLGEVPVIAFTATVFALFWWAMWHQIQRGRKESWWVWLIASGLARVAAFLLACATAVLATSFVVLWAITLQSESRLDVVTPVLITALEGAAEGMHVVIGSAETWIEVGLAAAGSQVRRLARLLGKSE